MKTKMQNRLILAVGCLGIIVGMATYALPDSSPDVPRRIYFDTVGGPVLFTHEAHAHIDRLKCGKDLKIAHIGCGDCHHEKIRPNHVKPCESCHPDEGVSPDDMSHSELRALHPPSCVTCHLQKEVRLKPCRACHGKTGDAKPVDCDRCHADAGYSASDMSHEDLESIEGHWCNECHVVRRESEAVHLQCNKCHESLACSTFLTGETLNADSSARCRVCHLKSR